MRNNDRDNCKLQIWAEKRAEKLTKTPADDLRAIDKGDMEMQKKKKNEFLQDSLECYRYKQ